MTLNDTINTIRKYSKIAVLAVPTLAMLACSGLDTDKMARDAMKKARKQVKNREYAGAIYNLRTAVHEAEFSLGHQPEGFTWDSLYALDDSIVNLDW